MFKFLLNPVSAVLGSIRGLIDSTGALREPLGSAINRIGRALSALGAGVEAAAIRSRIEREAAVQGQARVAVTRSGIGIFSESEIPDATTKLRRRYSFRGIIEYINPSTGRHEVRHVTISSDSLLSRAEVEQEMRDLAGGEYGIEEHVVTRMEVTDVRKAGAAGTL